MSDADCRNFPHYVLQVRTQREKAVAATLRSRGFFPYVPVFKSRRVWSDRIQMLEVPLFPGYVLCPFDLNRRSQACSVPNVIGLVSFGSVPTSVDSEELDAVRVVEERGIDVRPGPDDAGTPIRIESGPLRGVIGELVSVKGKDRLVVSISLLNRSVSTIIDRADAVLLSHEFNPGSAEISSSSWRHLSQ